jgi:beta-phosphoglucomutase-like phosphatase (HAD superfamily)
VIDAVVFDLDGVIVDSEQVWDEVRELYTNEVGGTYTESAGRDMMGMSSHEWSRYMSEHLGVPGSPEEINAEVVRRMLARYGEAPPLIPGAVEAVRRVAARWPLAIASSSNPELISVVVAAAGLEDVFPCVSAPRRWRAESRRPMCTSRRPGGSASTRATAAPWRTRTTASVRRRRPVCSSSPFRTRTTRPIGRR